MNWNKLVACLSADSSPNLEKFHPKVIFDPTRRPESIYIDTVRNRNLSPNDIRIFLNNWGRMRMPVNMNELESYLEMNNNFKKLLSYRFETANFDEIGYDVKALFGLFNNLDKRGGEAPVARAKTLHVLYPNLLVMWDNAILISYGCSNKKIPLAERYLQFQKRVQFEGEKVLQSLKNEKQLSDNLSASKLLCKSLYNDAKTFAKIMDEYNFVKYTLCSNEAWI
jgi:hypothetical protein